MEERVGGRSSVVGREAIERVQTQMLVDEYRALPVGDRLHASYWQLRSSVSGIAIEAHRRASVVGRRSSVGGV